MTTKQSNLEEEALKRKERLLSMKRKFQQNDESGADLTLAEDHSENLSLKRPIFRTYNPTDESLKEIVLPKVKPIEVKDEVQEQIEAAKETTVVEEIDLTTLAPRKIDWDLKRDVSKKLEKLERRTQRAIAELIRERLASGKQELLLSAVNSSMRADQVGNLSDDD